MQYMGACFVGSAACLILEYMPLGDLRTFLDGQTNWTWGPRFNLSSVVLMLHCMLKNVLEPVLLNDTCL